MGITKQAYSEVYAILNLLSWDLINKIPNNIWKNIDSKRDKDVIIEINNIEEYKPSKQTDMLLAAIYKNYFSTEEEKQVILAKEKILYKKEQEELYKKYNPDNVFSFNEKNTKIQEIKVEEVENIETSMIAKEENKTIFTKIIDWFKGLF